MSITASPTVPEHLAQQILDGKCVAFVGAGFSAPIVATWTELLTQLVHSSPATPEQKQETARFIAASQGRPLELEAAGQIIREFYDCEKAFESAVREALRFRSPIADHEIMRNRRERLGAIPFDAVLTLNMDEVLAGEAPDADNYRKVLRSPLPWWTRSTWNTDSASLLSRVVKLHGDANGDPEKNPIVLTRSAYRKRLYEDARYANFLRSVFATRTVLYLGFSFTDAYINELRSEVQALIGRSDPHPSGYAIMPNCAPAWCRWMRRHEGIEVLPYEAEGTDHGGFDRWLEAVHARTSPHARLKSLLARPDGAAAQVTWVDAHPENNGRGLRWLEDAGATVNRLLRPDDLDETQHSSSCLLVTRFGHRGEGQADAFDVLAKLSTWKERPPVLVFASGLHAEENRRACQRRGAWEYAYDWAELFALMERLLGRRPGRTHTAEASGPA